MAIFSGGKSTAIDSPRHLAIRHARKLVKAARAPLPVVQGPGAGDEGDDEPLAPGEEKINSYWAPGLAAGTLHRVAVTQEIEANNGTGDELTLSAEQDFFVDAPQFSLPDGAVHSVYPPPGYSDDHRILPHVVLTDPHLPWERLGSPKSAALAAAAAGPNDAPPRSRVPWLVVFSFSQDELRLSPDDLNGPKSLFRDTSAGVIKPVKQSSTMTINMSIADLWVVAPPGSSEVTTPITKKLGDPAAMEKERGDFIFIKPDLFTSLFSPFDKDGRRQVPANPDTVPYELLAHVRKINPAGMALAGVEDTAIFSIVVGNRAGPLDNALPTTMAVHLVAIEGVEAMSFPVAARYVALCSLHSWNYTVLPPGMLNVREAFMTLGSTLDVLRAPEGVIESLRTSGGKVAKRIAARLEDGYTLVKYQMQTGEPTMALYRGPFTPTHVHGLAFLTKSSNSGADLQVLDKDIGIMDITYSVAWQVGRTLALGDESFTAALGRLRTAIGGAARKAAKLATVKALDQRSIRTRDEVLGGLDSVAKSLAAIHIGHQPPSLGDGAGPPPFLPGRPNKRWQRHRLTSSEYPDLSLTAPAVEARYPGEALKAARRLAQSTDGAIYDETNDAQSTDWMTVLSWLVDRMFLAGVPAHCLVADPSYLEPERLRFFAIDGNWVDALVDGALSLGNHQGTDEDRAAIKKALNDYIGHVDPETGRRVQVPAYGFYLRSDLVTMFPDLRVQVLAAADAADGIRPASDADAALGAPLLRHEIVADGVMMGLMDRVPGSPDFASLVLTQPAHQQRFAAAGTLSAARMDVDVRRQYTVDQATRETDKDRHDALATITSTPDSPDGLLVWGAAPGAADLRILRLQRYAAEQLQTLRRLMPKYDDGGIERPYFDDDAPSSALLAMQLNDPVYNLTVSLVGTAALAGLTGPPGAGRPARALRQLAPARVLKSRNRGDDDTSRAAAAADDDDKAGSLVFERPGSYVAGPSAASPNLAPHVRAMPAVVVSGPGSPWAPGPKTAPPKGGGLGDDPAGPPRYAIRITSNVAGGTNVVLLQAPDNLPQDLVFAVAVQQNPSNQYRLVEFDLQLRLGPPPAAPGDAVFLLQRYDGAGPAMLTNLRFNVLAANTFVNGTAYLRLRLLPRSAKAWVQMTTVREMGFLLSLAHVNDTVQLISQLQVQSWAVYCRDEDPDDTIIIWNPDTQVTIKNNKYV